MPAQERVRVVSAHVTAATGVANNTHMLQQTHIGTRRRNHTSQKKQVKTKLDHAWVEKPTPGTLALVGAPLCDGQPLGGVNDAPDAFRESGLQQIVHNSNWKFKDYGDIQKGSPDTKTSCIPPGMEDSYYPADMVKNSIVAGAGVGNVCAATAAAAADGSFVLTVGGDHSIASGSITGILKHRPELAVIWIDAHGDCNTPDTSPSGNYHGMPLAHILGWFDKRVEGFEWCDDHLDEHGPLQEDRVALIALRDVDEEERELLRTSNAHVFSMADIDRHGIGAVMEEAIKKVDPKCRRPLHLSFDIDSCDPEIAPGTGTKARGGLSYREAHYICERCAMTGRLGSMDIVEVNPQLDSKVHEVMHGDDPDVKGSTTVRLGLELVGSAIGKTIV